MLLPHLLTCSLSLNRHLKRNTKVKPSTIPLREGPGDVLKGAWNLCLPLVTFLPMHKKTTTVQKAFICSLRLSLSVFFRENYVSLFIQMWTTQDIYCIISIALGIYALSEINTWTKLENNRYKRYNPCPFKETTWLYWCNTKWIWLCKDIQNNKSNTTKLKHCKKNEYQSISFL